jgi:hypothetical protein
MARTIDAIIKEVSSRSDPQRQTILNQVADIPRQLEAEESGLRAQLATANDDITNNARRMGFKAFGGIPLGEQAEFAATEFAPALARLRTSTNDRRSTLESALNNIGSNDFSAAQDIFRDERDFAENQRRFAIQQQQAAAARSAASAEQNILSKYGIDLNNLGGVSQGQNRPSLDSLFASDSPAPQSISVARTPANTLQSAGGVRLQGGGATLQGSTPRLQGGNFRLQGGGANSSRGLRVR